MTRRPAPSGAGWIGVAQAILVLDGAFLVGMTGLAGLLYGSVWSLDPTSPPWLALVFHAVTVLVFAAAGGLVLLAGVGAAWALQQRHTWALPVAMLVALVHLFAGLLPSALVFYALTREDVRRIFAAANPWPPPDEDDPIEASAPPAQS